MTINILAPLTHAEEVKALADAGANEFYCGISPKQWSDKYSTAGSINKKHMSSAQFKDFDELEKAVAISHERGIPVYLTINELYYTEGQIEAISDLIEKTSQTGIDAYIIADPALLVATKGLGIKTHISIGGAVFNSEAAKFYKELGASRIILPRHFRLDEAFDLAKKMAGMQLECIILKGRAVNICGLCTYNHFDVAKKEERDMGLACFTQWNAEVIEGGENLRKKRSIMARLKPRWAIGDSCGVCAMRQLEEHGFSSFKIPGRESTTESKIIDIAFLNRLKKMNLESQSLEGYIENTKKEYIRTYGSRCSSLKCHWAYERSKGFR